MQGALDFYGDDKLATILINTDSISEQSTADADRAIERYGMEGIPRVQMEGQECNDQLTAQLGQFGWGWIVIAADGTLLGNNVHLGQLPEMLDRAVGRERGRPDGISVEATVAPPEDYTIRDHIQSDKTASITLHVHLPEGWHVAADANEGGAPVAVSVDYAGQLVAGKAQRLHTRAGVAGQPATGGHVAVMVPLDVPKGTRVGEQLIHGVIRFTARDADGQLTPIAARWRAGMPIY